MSSGRLAIVPPVAEKNDILTSLRLCDICYFGHFPNRSACQFIFRPLGIEETEISDYIREQARELKLWKGPPRLDLRCNTHGSGTRSPVSEWPILRCEWIPVVGPYFLDEDALLDSEPTPGMPESFIMTLQ